MPETSRFKLVRTRQYIDKAIDDLELWQRMFDPSWFLILKIANPSIDEELSKDASTNSVLNNERDMRDTLKETPTKAISVFLPDTRLKACEQLLVPLSPVRCFREPPTGKYNIVYIMHCAPDANLGTQAVCYVHTLGFVDKNVRPESVLAFDNGMSILGSIFLIGFESFRNADGRTRRVGDAAWDRNLYRHPDRQGVHPEEDYETQHDIYSLGVCLLEIGLWDSLVS